MNYIFTENWYDIIPLLTTNKVKSIKMVFWDI